MTGFDIAAAKNLPDSTTVGLASKVVTALLSDCLYVEESGRHAGIRIVPVQMPSGLAVGQTVDVGGTMQTANGERYVADSIVSIR